MPSPQSQHRPLSSLHGLSSRPALPPPPARPLPTRPHILQPSSASTLSPRTCSVLRPAPGPWNTVKELETLGRLHSLGELTALRQME